MDLECLINRHLLVFVSDPFYQFQHNVFGRDKHSSVRDSQGGTVELSYSACAHLGPYNKILAREQLMHGFVAEFCSLFLKNNLSFVLLLWKYFFYFD